MKMISYFVRSSAVLLMAFWLSGCSVNPATGGVNLVLMSEKEELELGRKMHLNLMRAEGSYEDPALAEYVDRVGQKMAAKSDRSNIAYTFTVMDRSEVNAFALPGGYIYITRGLLAYLKTEDELAAVLGHEIGHVTARHAPRLQGRAGLVNLMGAIAAASIGSPVNFTGPVGEALVRGYGRDLELEADELGADYMSRVGYEKGAMINVLSALKDQEAFEVKKATLEGYEPNVYHGLFATHPRNDTRRRNIIRDAGSGSLEVSGAPDQTYLNAIDGMIFGSHVNGKRVEGRELQHKEFGISVRAPADWKMTDRGNRLEFASPTKDATMVLTRAQLNSNYSPEQILRSRRVGVKNYSDENSFSVGGYEAITVLSAPSNSPYGVRPKRYAVLKNDREVFVFVGAARRDGLPIQHDWRFLSIIKSLLPLSQSERVTADALRIKVKPAKEGDTAQAFASSLPFEDYAIDYVRLLNGWYPEGDPQVGQMIKVIE